MSDLKLRCARKKTDALVVTYLGDVALLDIDNDDEEPGYKDARVALKWPQMDVLAAAVRTRLDLQRRTLTLTFTRDELDRLSAALDAEDKALFERIEQAREAHGIERYADGAEAGV